MEYFITANKIPVHISDSEKGEETLLFLHGYMETFYIWEEFVELFTDRYRVIMMDLPGHGLTSSAPEENSMDFCAQVCKEVLDKCKVSKCTIIGHSLGGYIAQNFLRLYPDYVRSIININSHPYPDTPEVHQNRDREIDLIKGGKHLVLASNVIPKMYFKPNLRLFDDKILQTVELCEMHDPSGLAATVCGMKNRESQLDVLANTDKPVLFIFGDKDPYFSVEMIEELQKQLPRCSFSIVPDTAHCSFIEKENVVYERIIEFLAL